MNQSKEEQEKHTQEIINRVLLERNRQIVLHWTTEHDDQHDDGELIKAAVCYALGDTEIKSLSGEISIDINPFGLDLYRSIKNKPKIRRLEIAAALLVAEIERIERLERT